jgi:hypothetical protein
MWVLMHIVDDAVWTWPGKCWSRLEVMSDSTTSGKGENQYNRNGSKKKVETKRVAGTSTFVATMTALSGFKFANILKRYTAETRTLHLHSETQEWSITRLHARKLYMAAPNERCFLRQRVGEWRKIQREWRIQARMRIRSVLIMILNIESWYLRLREVRLESGRKKYQDRRPNRRKYSIWRQYLKKYGAILVVLTLLRLGTVWIKDDSGHDSQKIWYLETASDYYWNQATRFDRWYIYIHILWLSMRCTTQVQVFIPKQVITTMSTWTMFNVQCCHATRAGQWHTGTTHLLWPNHPPSFQM